MCKHAQAQSESAAMFPTRDVPKQEKKRHCAEASPAKGQDDPAQWQEAER